MSGPRKQKPLIRQDWIHNQIQPLGQNLYQLQQPKGYFLTRKGIPQGMYILRLKIDTKLEDFTACISIEPVGGSNARVQLLQIPIPKKQCDLSLPLVLQQRSRIRIEPIQEPSLFQATFSVLPTTQLGCLRLLRQWSGPSLDQSITTKHGSLKAEIQKLAAHLYQRRSLRHRSWQKVETTKKHQKQKDPAYRTYINSIESQLKPNEEQVKRWLSMNPDAPLISIILPTYNTQSEHLRDCIESIRNQLYPHWQLCICDDCSTLPHVRSILENYANIDERIIVHYREENGHICQASNDALALADGEYIALVDHDDLLPDDSLFWIANEILRNPQANLIYTDEDKIDENGARSSPHFKPAFNLDLLLSFNYISHLGVYRSEIVRSIDGFRSGLEGSQDHDLALRIIIESMPDQIIHIPRVLYHWRIHSQSTASDPTSKNYTTEKGQRAIQNYLDKSQQNGNNSATAECVAPNRFRCHWNLPDSEPSVELIIPTRDKAEILELAVRSILKKTDYTNYKICIVNNQSTEKRTSILFQDLKTQYPNKITILDYNKEFNYSAINNSAAKHSKADILGLINNDVEAINSDWLREMVSHAYRSDVGCVGAKLFYSNDTIQHGGVIIGIGEVAGHAHKYFSRASLGYTDRLNYTQQFSAVTAACMLVKRAIYYEVGGLNEQDLRIAFNDVDFCLRVHSRGYRNIFTPYAMLYHHESISRGTEDTPEKQQRFLQEVKFMLNQYDISNAGKLPSDLFYNPNLTGTHENFSLNFDLDSVKVGIRQRQRLIKQRNYYLRTS
tara:strand:+ start:1077 stop:3437 length:2361 start_codon:yes stop_codon:yes gene_type:complete